MRMGFATPNPPLCKAVHCLASCAWGLQPLNRCHLFFVLLAHGKKRTQERATALSWGLFGFFKKKKKNKNTQTK
jgi:hypothetical protein